MHLFRRPDYQSDATQFLNALKQQRPELDEQQRAGRELLWDKDVDVQQNADMQAGRVRQRAYVYQTNAD